MSTPNASFELQLRSKAMTIEALQRRMNEVESKNEMLTEKLEKMAANLAECNEERSKKSEDAERNASVEARGNVEDSENDD